MKLIVRADDVGYTVAHNMGTWKTVEEGVTTALDVMLDCPGLEDACQHIKQYPWLSLGWHTHFWGRPALDPKEVPSMVNEEGRFKWRNDKKLMAEVDYNEARRECRAQIERFAALCGRVPDTCGMMDKTPLGEAIRDTCDEFHIAYGFLQGVGYNGKPLPCKEQYLDKNIYEWTAKGLGFTKSLNVVDFPEYDVVGAITAMPIDDTKTMLRSQHPGFLDDYVLAESSCTIPRVKDVYALTCPEMKNWIRENKIELVNGRDALYGTCEYQQHLKAIGSDLCVL